jgi:hypothetical protein
MAGTAAATQTGRSRGCSKASATTPATIPVVAWAKPSTPRKTWPARKAPRCAREIRSWNPASSKAASSAVHVTSRSRACAWRSTSSLSIWSWRRAIAVQTVVATETTVSPASDGSTSRHPDPERSASSTACSTSRPSRTPTPRSSAATSSMASIVVSCRLPAAATSRRAATVRRGTSRPRPCGSSSSMNNTGIALASSQACGGDEGAQQLAAAALRGAVGASAG